MNPSPDWVSMFERFASLEAAGEEPICNGMDWQALMDHCFAPAIRRQHKELERKLELRRGAGREPESLRPHDAVLETAAGVIRTELFSTETASGRTRVRPKWRVILEASQRDLPVDERVRIIDAMLRTTADNILLDILRKDCIQSEIRRRLKAAIRQTATAVQSVGVGALARIFPSVSAPNDLERVNPVDLIDELPRPGPSGSASWFEGPLPTPGELAEVLDEVFRKVPHAVLVDDLVNLVGALYDLRFPATSPGPEGDEPDDDREDPPAPPATWREPEPPAYSQEDAACAANAIEQAVLALDGGKPGQHIRIFVEGVLWLGLPKAEGGRFKQRDIARALRMSDGGLNPQFHAVRRAICDALASSLGVRDAVEPIPEACAAFRLLQAKYIELEPKVLSE